MDYKRITQDMLEKSDSYVTAADKREFVDFTVSRCVDKIEIVVSNEEEGQALPPTYKVNDLRRRRYLMGAFVCMYLHQPFDSAEKDDPWLMDETTYDVWAGSHVFNQLERLKRQGGNLRDKTFDMLEDYNNLRRYFNLELDQMLRVMNDPCTRIMNMIQMQSSPEYVQEQMEHLESVVSALDDYKQKRGEVG